MGNTPTDLRPSPTTPLNPTIPQKVTNVSIYDKGPEPSSGSPDPMIEAGAPSTWVCRWFAWCARPTGGSHARTTRGLAQRGEGAMRRAAPKEREKRGPGRYRSQGFRAPDRLLRVLLIQHESNLQVDPVALDVPIFYADVHILDPCTFHAPKRLGSTGDGLVYGILEARL